MTTKLLYASYRHLQGHVCKILLVGCLAVSNIHSCFAQQWNKLVDDVNQISSVASYYTSITVLDNIPYVVYVEGSATGGTGKVKKRNFNTGVWEQVGGNLAVTNVSYTRIFSDKNNKLYVTYIDVSSGRLAALTYNTSTLAWEPLSAGNLYISTSSATYTVSVSVTRSGMAFDSNNVPYVAYSERTATTGYAFVKRFISGAWQTVGANISTDFAASTSIVLDKNDVPYVVYIQQATSTAGTGTIKTFRFNSSSGIWEDVSPTSPVLPGSSTSGATTAVRYTNITMDSVNNPMVAYFNASSSSRSTIINFNKSTSKWSWINAISTRDAYNNMLINDNGGNVYNMFSDALIGNGLSTLVRVFKLIKGASAFIELKNPNLSRGIDSTGDNSTVPRSVTIADLGIAVGSDSTRPFIVYTKTNASNIVVPIVQIFSTPITTKAVTNITATSATTGGDVLPDGISTIVERGVVYGTAIYPTVADTKIVDASAGSGSFTTTLTGLAMATGYHVRAYTINSVGGIVYGNDIAFATLLPDPNSVSVIDNGTSVILSNGIVNATIVKANATVTSLIYNGLEFISGGFGGGQLYWSWNMPNYQNPANCTYTLITDPHSNNFNLGEVKLHMTWDGTATTAAMDVDIYYSLTKGASGLYASATLSHPSSYPANPGGEWRMAGYPNPRFDWMSVDSLRNRLMANLDDLNNSTAVAGAPKEVTLLTTGVNKNLYECKYDYSADFGDINVWGWSSTADNVGLWMTAPSKEYYPGGPSKRELTCQTTPVLLNMIGGTHYLGAQENGIAAGENWQKTYGPFLIYCNKVPAGTANANMVLWKDAQAQALAEQAAWPYSWYTSNPNYIQENARGTVTGRLSISDISNPSASPANIWIGVAIPPMGSSSQTDFQNWSKNFQFWVKTDANGNFIIPHVLPGTYNLYACGPGAAGQLSLMNYATVTAGNTTALGTVTWNTTHVAATVWEIGIPDRTAKEYKHGSDYWTSNVYPNPHWAKFMDYVTEFPNDVNFTIGQSNIATDWNFVQTYDKTVQSTSPNWRVNFNLANAPTAGSTASVYVALAENYGSALIMSVNGTNVTLPATGASPGNYSDGMIRKGIHSAFAEVRFNFPASYLQAGANQISFTLRITGSATSGEVMYDYLRLEADGTTQTVLPVTFGNIQAYQKATGIQVDWQVLTEENIKLYEVERSTDGQNFTKIGTVPSKGNSNITFDYGLLDAVPNNGNNFYRIRSIGVDGSQQYSKVVKVTLANLGNASLIIYPNPIIGNTINLQLNNLEMGDYKLILTNKLGQQIFSKTITNNSVALGQSIALNQDLTPGVYQLTLAGHDRIITQQVVKK